MIPDYRTLFDELIKQALDEYGLMLAVFTLGLMTGIGINRFMSDRKYVRQVKLRIKDKDEYIASLKYIVYERLNHVKVEKIDKRFILKVKKFFKTK